MIIFFQAKMLAEMDEEFGIGSLVQDQMKREREEVSFKDTFVGIELYKGAVLEISVYPI